MKILKLRLSNTLLSETFAGRKFRGFVVFLPTAKSFFTRENRKRRRKIRNSIRKMAFA